MGTLGKRRAIASFFREVGVVLGVMCALAYLTWLWLPHIADQTMELPIIASSGLLLSYLISTRVARPGETTSGPRPVVGLAILLLVIGLLAFASLRVLSGARLSAFVLEAAIAIPMSVALLRWLAVRYAIHRPGRERLLILGSGETARQTCRWIRETHSDEYTVLGVAAEDGSRVGQNLTASARIVTGFDSLQSFCSRGTDRIVVALDEKRGRLPVKQLLDLRLRGIEIEDSTSFFERNSGKICVESLLPSWLIFGDGFRVSRVRSAFKRWVDILHALTLLLVTWPIFVVAALLVRLESKGPVLYRQDRMGKNGREFTLLKFRSMVEDAESETGPAWATEDDPRVTRVGRMLRSLRIDELPQLVNVLRGEMSFVGPRPERKHFVMQLEEKIPFYGLRLAVRPGLTGWAQVKYGYASNEENALEKLKYDLYYIKNGSPLLDLWIVLKTVRVVITRKGV